MLCAKERAIVSQIWIVLALIAANGVLSGAEIAVVSVRPARLDALVAQKKRSAHALARLRRDPERFLATVQVGITVVSAAAAAFGGASFAAELEPFLRRASWIGEHAGQVALVLVVAAISYLSIVVGELVPKSLALRHSEVFALAMARPLLGLALVARPFVWLLTASSNVLLRPFRDRTNFLEARVSLEEVRHMVEQAAESGSVDPGAGEIAARALEFSTLTAEDVMIHRRYVVGLSEDAEAAEIRRVLLDVGHRRVPVYRDSLDHIVGYVSWRDVMERVWNAREVVLAELLRPCHFVPETTQAIDLLKEMQAKRIHLAIAVDEHGGTAGIVTMEDLLEELVGEIFSEHDKHAGELVRTEPDGSWIVPGDAPIREVSRATRMQLPGEDEATTIAGLCVLLVEGRIPKTGERLDTGTGVEIEVLDASVRRVRSVRLRAKAPEPREV